MTDFSQIRRRGREVMITDEDRRVAEQDRELGRVDGRTGDPDNVGENKVRGRLGEAVFANYLEFTAGVEYEETDDGHPCDFVIDGDKRVDVKTRDLGNVPDYISVPDMFVGYAQHHDHEGDVDWYVNVVLSEDWNFGVVMGGVEYDSLMDIADDHPKFQGAVLVNHDDLQPLHEVMA